MLCCLLECIFVFGVFSRRIQSIDDVVQRFRAALCAANVIIICLTPVYLTRPNCLRELRWSLDFAARGMKRVVLLPLHPAVTFNGVSRMTQLDAFRGLVFSAREKNAMNISCAALELLTHVKFKSQMTQLPCHELQVMSVLCTIYSRAHSHFDFSCLRLGLATL